MTGKDCAGAVKADPANQETRPPFRRWRLGQQGWEAIGDVYPAAIITDPEWNERAGLSAPEREK